MKAFAFALVAGAVVGNSAFAGDLGAPSLRQPLAPTQLRPSISRPSLTEGFGVHAPAQPSGPAPAYGYSPPPSAGGAGWSTTPAGEGTGARSYSSTGVSSGVPGAGPAGASGSPPEYGAPLPPGVSEGAAARRAMGFDSGGMGRDGVALPPGLGEGAVVRKSMGMDINDGSGPAGDVLPPGVGEGAVVRRAMGIDDSGRPGPAASAKASESPTGAGRDADSGHDEKTPRHARGSGAPDGGDATRSSGDSGPSVQWEYMRGALRTGITKLLKWAGDY